MAEMKKVVLGDVLIQDNQQRVFASDLQYIVVWVKLNEDEVPLMLTHEEFDAASFRATVNQEDVPELGSETSINEFDKE